MSYQDKVDGALALVREHNLAFVPEGTNFDGPAPEGYIDITKFSNCIKFKARNEDALKGLKYEQILECLPSCFGTKPDSLAKDIAKVFRGNEEVVKGPENSADEGGSGASLKKAEKMSWRQLVQNLDPSDPASPVAKRLDAVAKGRKFIVFSSGRIVDVEASLKLLMELKEGYDAREYYNDREVHPIGKLPESYADENPIYKDRPLRPDGTCDQTNRSWEGVPLDVRQFIRVAIDRGDVNVSVPNGIQFAHGLMDLATAPDALTKLRQRYTATSVEYNKLAATGSLPKLKIELGRKTTQARPFAEGQKVLWERNRTGYVARPPQ